MHPKVWNGSVKSTGKVYGDRPHKHHRHQQAKGYQPMRAGVWRTLAALALMKFTASLTALLRVLPLLALHLRRPSSKDTVILL